MTGASHVVSLLLDRELLALNRVVGELRRRDVAVERISVRPAERPGLAQVTVVLDADAAVVAASLKKLQKLSGVRAAVTFPADADGGGTRELALVRVREPEGDRAALQDVIERFHGEVLEEGPPPDGVLVQVVGSTSFIVAFIRAIEAFGALEVARSGPVALEPAPRAVP